MGGGGGGEKRGIKNCKSLKTDIRCSALKDRLACTEWQCGGAWPVQSGSVATQRNQQLDNGETSSFNVS